MEYTSSSAGALIVWPELSAFADWEDTFDTLHMWTQIVGKIRLELSPRINHSWGCAFYVTSRGLTTSPIPFEANHAARTFTVDFDFVAHRLCVATSDGAEISFALEPMPVAEFYRKTMRALVDLGVAVKIYTRPVEVVTAIPFENDLTHASYDAGAVQRVWRAFALADQVFKIFRARFIGKASPVHFFWGSFDLAATRFSGRLAPRHPGGAPNCPDEVMVEAYSHELSSAGFWPGAGLGKAAFYAYSYPNLPGFKEHPVSPDAAYFHPKMGEFILPYDVVRTAADPTQTLLSFLQSTYEAAAITANWDRPALERS